MTQFCKQVEVTSVTSDIKHEFKWIWTITKTEKFVLAAIELKTGKFFTEMQRTWQMERILQGVI